MAPRRSFQKTTGPMDQWLETQGYYRKHTARDGSCLFRAVSEQMFYTQAVHQDVRRQCVEFIQRNKYKFEKFLEEPIEEYATRMMSSREWGGMLEIQAMALLYKRDMVIFQDVGKIPNPKTDYGFEKKIQLCLSPDNHYDSVYSKQYIVKAGFCQSLAYEVLYKNVFKLNDVNYAVNKMLHDKTSRLQKERLLNEDLLSCGRPGRFGFSMEISLESNKDYRDESTNVKELLAHGITPFPYKVAKALDENTYRNIEFDIWNDYRRELKFGWYRNNGEFQVGVKCLVKLNPERNFHAHIQEMSPDKGPVIVFVEELGEKCTVPYDNLEPLPSNEKPQWSLPYKHCRQLSNIQPKSALFTFTDIGGKWKKSKVGKSRKMKENPMHTPLSPRLQFNNKVNPTPTKYSTQHCNRFIREQMENQQMQMPYQSYTPENFNNMQNYNNVAMEMPSMHASLMMEQTNPTSNPAMSQAMMIFSSPSVNTSNNIPHNQTQSAVVSSTTSEKDLSPIQQPDSTTDIQTSQQPSTDTQLTVDTSLCNQSAHLSPSQYISFGPYSNPQVANHATMSTTATRPETASNPGIVNSSTCYTDTRCSNTSTLQHVICNNGVNVNYTNIPGGHDQSSRDMNANILFQPVNFMAQKSMHLSGSDLPLADVPTLRFYYNLGHDYFRLSCMYWPTSVQQTKTNYVHPSTTAHNENQHFGNAVSATNSMPTNEQHAPDSAPMSEDLYQFGQDVSQNFLLPNEQSSHGPCDENKAVCFHNNVAPVTTTTNTGGSNTIVSNGESEVSWQSKQVDGDVSRPIQKVLSSSVPPRINNNSYDVRSHQNPGRPNEQCEMQTVVQQPQDFDVCARTANEAHMPVHSHSLNMVSSTFSVPPPNAAPPTMPFTFSPVPHPTMYSPSVVPFYYPVDNEQNIVPMQYYPQYTINPPIQLTAQDATDSTLSVTEVQTTASPHMAGSLCQMQQSGIESGCFTSCAVYPSPSPPQPPPPPQPAPLLFQQPSSLPSGLFSASTAPVANIQVPRWMQTASSPPHMTPTQCIFQPQQATLAATSMGYNAPAV